MVDAATTATGVRSSLTGFFSSFRSPSSDDSYTEDQSHSLHTAPSESSTSYYRTQKNNEYRKNMSAYRTGKMGPPPATDSSYSESVDDDGEQGGTIATAASSSSRFSASAPAAPQSNAVASLDSILKTVFGSCTGVQQAFVGTLDDNKVRHRDNEDDENRRRSPRGVPRQSPSSSRRRNRSVTRKTGKSGSQESPSRGPNAKVRAARMEHDECYYARFYADDHAQAAQAVLQLREKEEADRVALLAAGGVSIENPQIRSMVKLKELGLLHQRSNHPIMGRQIGPEVVSELVPIDRSSSNQPSNTDDEAGRLGAIALLAPAASADTADEKTHIDFDDGISALSAHTLEDMARRDAMMTEAEKAAAASGDKFQTAVAAGWRRHKARQASEAAALNKNRACDLPIDDNALRTKSPKVEDRKASVRANDAREDNDNNENLHHAVKLDRGLSAISHGSRRTIGESSSGTTTTNFESVWKKEEAKYWQDVAEGETGDGGKSGRHRRKTKMKSQGGDYEQKKSPQSKVASPSSASLSSLSSHNYHPHDTISPIIASTVSSPTSSGKKSKNRTRKSKLSAGLSRRGRKGYQNFDVDNNGFPTENIGASTEEFEEI